MRLVEANPISGALKFELPDGGAKGGNDTSPKDNRRSGKGRPNANKKNFKMGKRGRPANIKHKGRKKK